MTRLSFNLWPRELQERWRTSRTVKGWSPRHASTVRSVVERFLGAFPPSSTQETSTKGPWQAFYEGIRDEGGLKPATLVSYIEFLFYGMRVLHPKRDFLALKNFGRELRREMNRSTPGPSGADHHRPTPEPHLPRLPKEDWPEDLKQRWIKASSKSVGKLTDRYKRRAKRPRVSWPTAAPYGESEEETLPARDLQRHAPRLERGLSLYLAWAHEADTSMKPMRESVEAFVEEASTTGEAADSSIVTYLYELHGAMLLLWPEEDWHWLQQDMYSLKAVARPRRDKRARYVPIEEIIKHGDKLMREADRRALTLHSAAQFRDGLLLALLCFRPKRISNITGLRLGDGLKLNDRGEPISISIDRTKNGDPSDTPFPKKLVRSFRRYLERYRPVLLGEHPDEDWVWLSGRGTVLTRGQAGKQITSRTKKAFGAPIGPHMLRTCFATRIAGVSLKDLPFVQNMLDHRDDASMEHYELLGRSIAASRALDAVLSPLEQARGTRPGRQPRWSKRRRKSDD